MKSNEKSPFSQRNVLLMLSFLLLFVVLSSSNALSEDVDVCEISYTEPTVIIDGCDSGVSNVAVDQNCTIYHKILQCAVGIKTHGDFVNCIAELTNTLKRKKIITGEEKEKIQTCAAEADIPCKKCASAITTEPHRFSFETGTDELSVEIRKVYQYYITALTPDVDMVKLEQEQNEGIMYLRNHPEAAGALISEALLLNPLDSSNLMTIFYLLGFVDNDDGVNFLYDQVTQPTPESCLMGSDTICSDYDSIRSSALKALGNVRATSGNALALEKMLELVNSEDAFIQGISISLVYDKGGISRWRAKRLMRNQLPVCKQYLLHNAY